jgi:hypothetical protein
VSSSFGNNQGTHFVVAFALEESTLDDPAVLVSIMFVYFGDPASTFEEAEYSITSYANHVHGLCIKNDASYIYALLELKNYTYAICSLQLTIVPQTSNVSRVEWGVPVLYNLPFTPVADQNHCRSFLRMSKTDDSLIAVMNAETGNIHPFRVNGHKITPCEPIIMSTNSSNPDLFPIFTVT